MASDKRIEELDFLRGMAMVLVILGHTGLPGEKYVLAFHMPLFFLLSGIALSLKPVKPFREFIRSRFTRLIVPYFAFEIISLGISVLLCLIHKDPIDIPGVLSDILMVRPSFGATAHTGLVYRFWFFPCLFLASLIVFPVLYFSRNRMVQLLYAAFLFLAGFLVSKYFPSRLPFTMDIAVVAAGYIVFGFVFSRPVLSLLTERTPLRDLLLILTGTAGLILSVRMNTESVLFYMNSYGSFGWMLFGSICGIVVTVILSKYLYRLFDHLPILSKGVCLIGVNTLPLFPIHMIAQYFIFHIYPLHWLILFPITVAVSLPLACLVTKYLPLLAGSYKRVQAHP